MDLSHAGDSIFVYINSTCRSLTRDLELMSSRHTVSTVRGRGLSFSAPDLASARVVYWCRKDAHLFGDRLRVRWILFEILRLSLPILLVRSVAKWTLIDRLALRPMYCEHLFWYEDFGLAILLLDSHSPYTDALLARTVGIIDRT